MHGWDDVPGTLPDGQSGYAPRAEIESYSQIDPGDLALGDMDWNTLLDHLQGHARARIDTYCRRDFADHSGSLSIDGGRGGKRILRVPYPLRDVTAVRVDGTLLSEADYAFKRDGSLIKTGGSGPRDTPVWGSGSPPGLQTAPKPTWPSGYGNIEVDCTFGYETPPQDVVAAEVQIVDNTLLALSKKREAPIIQTDDFALEVDYPSVMTAEIRGMLEAYRVTEVGV